MEDGLSGDVDFDFFEEGDRRSPVRKNGESPTHSVINGKPPIPSPAKTPTNVKHGEDTTVNVSKSRSCSDDSDISYSSDYDSDDNKGDSKTKEVKKINARLPSADSGGRRNSPHQKTQSKSRHSHASRGYTSTSSTSSASDSDSDNTDSRRHGQRNRSRSDDSYNSSSAYSHSSSDDDKRPSPKPKNSQKRTAWDNIINTNSPEKSVQENEKSPSVSDRPKTSLRRRGRHVPRRLSVSDSRSDTGSSTDSESESNSNSQKSSSESEITDVSPLQSADSSPVMKRKGNRKHVAVISAPSKESYRQYRELPDTAHSNTPNDRNTIRPPAEGTMEFKLLMQAVKELDSEKQKRLKSSSRRVMFAPANINHKREKNNYSFSSLQARDIDHENERLLQELIRKRLPVKKRTTQLSQPARRLPNSAVNRIREQRRIEQENLALLQRLQGIQPTRGMTKNEQLTAYQKQMQYGVPGNTLGHRSKTSITYRPMSQLRSMSSMSSLRSGMTTPSSTGSRSRPQSAKKFVADTRPAWDERW